MVFIVGLSGFCPLRCSGCNLSLLWSSFICGWVLPTKTDHSAKKNLREMVFDLTPRRGLGSFGCFSKGSLEENCFRMLGVFAEKERKETMFVGRIQFACFIGDCVACFLLVCGLLICVSCILSRTG